MLNSILISKVIYSILIEDEEINKYVNKQIYPLVAEANTNFPFITFTRDSINTISSKDGYYEDNITFSINVVSANYLSSLEIANRVRQLFQRKKIASENLMLYDVTLTSINEEYTNDAYVQALTFTCTAN